MKAHKTATDRRDFLRDLGISLGVPISSVFYPGFMAEASGRDPLFRGPHHQPTARNVILLFMSGGPSHVDSFDPKPLLAKYAGEDVPESIAKSVPAIPRAGLKNLMPSPWSFAKYGESGLDVSELFPRTAQCADELCVIRSMNHRNPVHGPGECVALTGTGAGNRPSIGAWSIYGLGGETPNLPPFMALNLHTDGMQFPQFAGWGTGFLPARYQGTVIDPESGIRHVQMPEHTSRDERMRQLALLETLNQHYSQQQPEHSELEARTQTYDRAFRLQSAAPELFEWQSETRQTQSLYGTDRPETRSTGLAYLLARRMVERGVRFVQIRVGGWDAHGNLLGNHRRQAARTDIPTAALLTDLKRRGLLDSTLVVWAGEFGRTPTMEGIGKGRDHSPAGYSVWLAGGGVRGGQVIGRTDELGYVAQDRPVSPHDLHATMLHALGLDAARLTYQHHGRDEVPTVFGGEPVLEAFG